MIDGNYPVCIDQCKKKGSRFNLYGLAYVGWNQSW